MWVFNRLIMILLLAGLFVLGIYTVVYSLNLFGYSLDDLPRALGVSGFYQGLETFVGNAESGNLSVLTVITLIVIALLGLILLIAELKPPAPRRVRLQRGIRVTRGAVADEVVAAAERTPGVLGTSSRVKAMPASRLSGSALMVVDRACMAPLLRLVAAPRRRRHWRSPWL